MSNALPNENDPKAAATRPLEFKECSMCHQHKPATEQHYHKYKDGTFGLQSRCKICIDEDNLKKKFGISLAEYNRLFKQQAGKCAICTLRFKRRLCVDHCHYSLRIRGLLCRNCNLGVGYFGDSAERLRAAADYLDAANREQL